jgi:hypothetical protein
VVTNEVSGIRRPRSGFGTSIHMCFVDRSDGLASRSHTQPSSFVFRPSSARFGFGTSLTQPESDEVHGETQNRKTKSSFVSGSAILAVAVGAWVGGVVPACTFSSNTCPTSDWFNDTFYPIAALLLVGGIALGNGMLTRKSRFEDSQLTSG